MPQGVGANAQLTYVEEVTWGTTPGTPAMTLLKAATYGEGLTASIEEIVSNAINSSRSVESVRGGNIAVGGAIPFELPLLGIGTILKHALGTATSGRKATASATPIAGVTIRYAHSSCPTGAGTLAFTASGTTLTWTPNGSTAGAAVDVSAGGDFSLQGGGANETLYVRVTAGSLPGVDDSDTITVSSTQYTHIIKRGALPAGLTIEKGFTDIDQYFVYTGIKIQQMSLAVANSGMVTGSLDVLGKSMSASGTSLDSSPTTTTHSPVVHHEAAILEGGASATILGLNATITNKLKEDDYNVGSRYRAALQEGKGDATGTATFLFEDLTIYNKWLNETASSIKLTFTVSGGSIEFNYPAVKYFGEGVPKIETDQGIVQAMNFRAYYDSTEASDVVITIINTEATI